MIDHFKQALNDLLSQYRYALRIRAFLQAVSEAVQTQEASRFGLQEGASLDAARGIMLDRSGLRLRENRGTPCPGYQFSAEYCWDHYCSVTNLVTVL